MAFFFLTFLLLRALQRDVIAQLGRRLSLGRSDKVSIATDAKSNVKAWSGASRLCLTELTDENAPRRLDGMSRELQNHGIGI